MSGKIVFLIVCLLTASLLCACQGGVSRSQPVERPASAERAGAGQQPAQPGAAGAITPRGQGLGRVTLAASPAAGPGAAGLRVGAGAGRQGGPGAASRLTPPPLPPYTPGAAATQIANLPTPAGAAAFTPLAVTPGARATVETVAVSPEQAAQVLAAAIEPLKGQAVRVTGAVGYSGSASVSLPEPVATALERAVGAGGTAYYGMYQGVNQAATAQAAGSGASGSMTALVEPQRAYPADATAALAQTTALFPGAMLSQTIPAPASIPELANSYLYYGVAGDTAYVGGFAQYQGLNLAFVLAASGSLQTALPLP